MSKHIRTSKTGRTIIESDGYDEKWGATMQGAWVGKVSLPPSVKIKTDNHGEQYAEWESEFGELKRTSIGETFADACHQRIPGAICYNIRQIF